MTRCVHWSAGAALVLLASTARAQTAPPQLTSQPRVEYPRGATGDATVVLELSISRAGEVRSVQIVRGQEPFASAARDMAFAWRFRPASRDDAPVPGRLKMAVDFRQPRSGPAATGTAPVPASTGGPSTPPAPPPPTAAPLTADHADPSVETMTRAQARRVAGAFGDAGRAIEALPGVMPVVSGLGFFIIRGAAPGESAYYVDGIRVPALEHLGPAPIVSSGLVDRVELFPGAAPARFGRSTGATLQLDTPEPSDRVRLETVGSPYDASALVEAPLADGRGSALVAGRFSYASAILSLAIPGQGLGYWDYQARTTWKLDPDDRLSLLVFGGLDSISDRDATTERVLETQFHRVDLRYDRRLGGDGRATLAATVGADSTSHATSTWTDRLASLRFAAEGNLEPQLRLRGGADALFDRYDAAALASPSWPSGDPLATLQAYSASLSPPRTDLTFGGWTDLVWRPWDAVEVTPGLRFDLFSSRFDAGVPAATSPASPDAAASIDPRLALHARPSDDVGLTGTLGTSHSRPATFLPLPGADGGRLPEGLQSIVQTSLGGEVALPWDLVASAVGFYARTHRPDPVTTCVTLRATGQADGSCLAQSPDGETVGIELRVGRVMTERLAGWIGYTLSSTTREAHPIPTPGQVSAVPSELDRTHVLDAVGSYELGDGWTASAHGLIYSGRPWSLQSDTIPLQPYNGQRMPLLTRLDLKLEKLWRHADGRSVSVAFDWLNATLRSEPVGVSCGRAGDFPAPDPCSVTFVGPVTVPNLVLEARL